MVFLIPAQVLGQERIAHTMDISGISSMSVKPDETSISLAISTLRLQYEDAIDDLNRKTRDLTKQLRKVNFRDDDIKTTDFTVRKNTIYRYGHRVDSGFIAAQYLTVTFPYDRERIGDIIKKIGGSDAGADLQFSFGLSDATRKSLRDQLIRMAVEDAKEKASIIAAAAGIQLKGISNIKYSEMGGMPQIRSYKSMARMDESAPEAQVEAKEIEIGEQIQISWTIEN